MVSGTVQAGNIIVVFYLLLFFVFTVIFNLISFLQLFSFYSQRIFYHSFLILCTVLLKLKHVEVFLFVLCFETGSMEKLPCLYTAVMI